jgi:tetratricopeptide (TPR) repeat protein
MTKRIALFLLLAMMPVFTVIAVAQRTTTVKGVCKDETGKPMAGVTVELDNLDDGHKTSLKTDNRGAYFSIGAIGGNYKISLIGTDGKLIYYLSNVPLKLGVENVYDLDLSKQKAAGGKDTETEEQRKAIEQAKKNSEKIKGLNALLQQATAQEKEGNFDAAVATMEQAAAVDQTHDVVYGTLGDSYVGAKKYPEAEVAYNKAIAIAPPTSKAIGNYHNGLAQALLKQNKTDLAMAEYSKAAQLDPANASMYYYNAGAVLTNQGKADDANQAFDKAIAADPTRPDPYYQKGINLLAKATVSKDGKMTAAPGTTEALNKYLELAPDGKFAQAAKDLLASLGAPVQTSFGSQKKATKK